MVSPTKTDPGLTLNTRYSDHDPGDPLRGRSAELRACRGTRRRRQGPPPQPSRSRWERERVVVLVNRGAVGFQWYGPICRRRLRREGSSLGLVTTELDWRAQRSYTSIARRAAAARPQLVFFAGHTQYNARRLLEDVRRQARPTTVVFAAGDQFVAAPSLPEAFGPVGEGLRVDRLPCPVRGTCSGRDDGSCARSARLRGRLFEWSSAEGGAGRRGAAGGNRALERHSRRRSSRSCSRDEAERRDSRARSRSTESGDITPATVALYSIRNGEVVVDGVVRVPSRPDN